MTMRIISLAPNITDILLAFDLKENIIASTNFCSLKGKKIGGWINLNYEEINKLNADYVISCIFKPNKSIENLIHFDVSTLDEIYLMIKELGEIFNKEEKAEELINSMRYELEKIKEQSKKRKMIKVYNEEFPYFAGGNWVPEILEICNAYPFLKKGEKSRRISFQEVKNFDPEVIVLHYCGYKETNKEEILKRREWHSLKAVKEERIFSIKDDYLNRPSHILIEGAKLLNTLLSKINL